MDNSKIVQKYKKYKRKYEILKQFGGASTTSKPQLIAANGKFVAGNSKTSEIWVYDVKVYILQTLVAVVGFTNKNLNGAVFYQGSSYASMDLIERHGYETEDIRIVGKRYFDTRT